MIWREGITGASPPPKLQFQPFPPDLVQKIGSMSAFFLDAYQRSGSIYQFDRSGKSYVVLSGVEANKFMNQAGHNFIYAQEYRAEQNEELDIQKNLVSMTGEAHHQFRKLHKRGYARSALNTKYPELLQMTQDCVQQWKPNERIPVVDVLLQLIAEQLGIGVVNYPLGDYLDDITTFVRTVTIETVARIRPRQVLDTAVYKRAKSRSLELADKVIAAHRGCPLQQREPDVLDDLLAEMEADPELMTEQELRISALNGYIGGLDTVAYSCAFLLYNLLKHPDALARVTKEVDATFANGGLTPQSLKKMNGLHAATLETLRLYPVSPAIQGTVFAPFEFCGYQIEAGQEIIVGVTVPHHLSEYYPDPFSFDIDRYSNSDRYSGHRQPGAFAPFGIGEHLCLGAGMAETFMMLTIASLLHTTSIEMDPPEYKLKISSLPTPKPDDFYVRVIEKR